MSSIWICLRCRQFFFQLPILQEFFVDWQPVSEFGFLALPAEVKHRRENVLETGGKFEESFDTGEQDGLEQVGAGSYQVSLLFHQVFNIVGSLANMTWKSKRIQS